MDFPSLELATSPHYEFIKAKARNTPDASLEDVAGDLKAIVDVVADPMLTDKSRVRSLALTLRRTGCYDRRNKQGELAYAKHEC